MCRDRVMTWDELRDLARDPRVTIGAHHQLFCTVMVSTDEAREEITCARSQCSIDLGAAARLAQRATTRTIVMLK
jgi:hypothetical protein